MKIKFRFTALLLAAVLGFSLGAAGCGGTSVAATKTYLPMTSDAGDVLSFENPDRGFRTEAVFHVGEIASERTFDNMVTKAFSIFNNYLFTLPEPTKLCLAYVYLTDYHEAELPEEALQAVKAIFEVCRIKEFKLMLRFAYCDDSGELQKCANEQTIIRHIRQLSDIVAEYSDCIHTLSSGFCGAYGEWAEVYQQPAVDRAKVIKEITEKLAVPNGLYFQIRRPDLKNLVGEDYEYYWSIGHNNDALYGEQLREGFESGGYQLGTPEWAQVTEEGAYTPQDGEMFVNTNLFRTNRIPVGFEVMLELAHHRHTSVSFWHGYHEAYNDDNVMKRWQSEAVTAKMLEDSNIVYDPNWFLDDSGNTVERNIFEFIRDHLGYKLVVSDAVITGENKTGAAANVTMNFKNYGFAAAYNLTSGFAILDKDYNVVSTVEAGEPSKWYSHDPDDADSTVVLDHSISADITLPDKGGKYYIAFYLKNTMDDYARLSNRDIVYTDNGFNILHEFDL